ncbi:hypothetical protein C8T65DRAFT_727197 [Cerioporus squamosus]|nr:hypothetical protein C8T65DRAFT_727197 [Cerioporus squamosus]
MAIFKTRVLHANPSLFADHRFPTNPAYKNASVSQPRSVSAPTTTTDPVAWVPKGNGPRRDTHTHIPLLDTPSPPPAPAASLALVSLSFAQSRKDIRWRKEGFEMASSDPDVIPFAIRTHTLVPLDIAYARDDIRRRTETFESRPLPISANHLPARTSCSAAPTMPSSSPSRPTIHAYQSTLPSVYSQSSWNEDEETKGAEDTVTAVYEVYNGLTPYELGYGATSDEAVVGMTSISLSSFDEASFLRMAEDSLGW